MSLKELHLFYDNELGEDFVEKEYYKIYPGGFRPRTPTSRK